MFFICKLFLSNFLKKKKKSFQSKRASVTFEDISYKYSMKNQSNENVAPTFKIFS